MSLYILFKRSFITDDFLLKKYDLKVYLKNDLETNATFSKFIKLEVL